MVEAVLQSRRAGARCPNRGGVKRTSPFGRSGREGGGLCFTGHDAIRGAQAGEDPVHGGELQAVGGHVAAQLGQDQHQATLRHRTCTLGTQRFRTAGSRERPPFPKTSAPRLYLAVLKIPSST